LKLSALFAKFLYQHKELKLPGIGIFSIDPSIPVPEATEKNFSDFTNQIKFVQKPITAADEEFINFIRTETGKIKPLAVSDLESFLSDGKILLNIGKPFTIEGIGFLQKNREGNYEFTPGEPILQRYEAQAVPKETAETTKARHTSIFTEGPKKSNGARNALIVAGVVVAIAFIVWAGYGLSSRNGGGGSSSSDSQVISEETSTKANTILDSVQRLIDSTKNAVTSTAGSYKFVIERTRSKGRAYRRFNQIKENGSDIKMESAPDSSLLSLYFVLPVKDADTTRVKDSLKVWYGRREVFIER
jgi:hypothetical protein